jgi:hypothetical protein
MSDDDSTENVLRPLGKPEPPKPKPSPLKPINPVEPPKPPERPKPGTSMPPGPEGKSADFVKGYRLGYEDKQNNKPKAY